MKNNMELIALLDEIFKEKTVKEWGKLLDENDVLWAPVQTYGDVITDPQVLANGYIAEVNDPKHGAVRIVKTPVEFSETPAAVEKPAPEVGEHNEDVLGELGYGRDQIQELRNQRVIL